MDTCKKDFIKGKILHYKSGNDEFIRTRDVEIGEIGEPGYHTIAGIYTNGYEMSVITKSFPDAYKFIGAVIDEKFYGYSKTSIFYEKDEKVEDIYEYLASAKKSLIDTIVVIAAEKYGDIEAKELSYEEKLLAREDFTNGNLDVSDEDLKNSVLLWLQDDITKRCEHKRIEELLIESEIEQINKEALNAFSFVVSKRKAVNDLMKSFANDEVPGDVMIKRILKKLKDVGAKYVHATFNFGYCKVEEDISTNIMHYTFLKTQADTRFFEEKYAQLYQENVILSGNSYSSFIPFIEKLTRSGKTIYERTLVFDEIPKRQFYNLIYQISKERHRSRTKHANILMEQAKELIESGKIVFTEKDNDRIDLLSEIYYMRGFVASSKEFAQLLIQHGYNKEKFLQKMESYALPERNEMRDFIGMDPETKKE